MKLNPEFTQIGLTIVTLIASYFLAQWFGDKAGTQAAIKYEEEKDAKAQIIALQALLNEVRRIYAAAKHNSQLDPRGHPLTVARLPTMSFETAFFSKESNLLTTEFADLDKAPPLLDRTLSYLSAASAINLHIDAYLSLMHTHTPTTNQMGPEKHKCAEKVIDECAKLPPILDRLEKSLKEELLKKSS